VPLVGGETVTMAEMICQLACNSAADTTMSPSAIFLAVSCATGTMVIVGLTTSRYVAMLVWSARDPVAPIPKALTASMIATLPAAL